jgi:hypothetical protein
MAGGKSTKRVNLRTKIARKQQAQHTGTAAASEPASLAANKLSHSSTSLAIAVDAAEATRTTTDVNVPYGHAVEDRQVALHIRDALRQRHGRTSRAPVMSGSSIGSSGSASAAQGTGKAEERVRNKRQSAKKESKKDRAAMHPAAVRRVAAQERKRLMLPPLSAAEARMAAAQAELQLFEKVQTVPAYAVDPFAAVMQHLSATMVTLKPQTPDTGRAPRG